MRGRGLGGRLRSPCTRRCRYRRHHQTLAAAVAASYREPSARSLVGLAGGWPTRTCTRRVQRHRRPARAVAAIEARSAAIKDCWAGWLGKADVLVNRSRAASLSGDKLCLIDKLYEAVWDVLKVRW